MTPGVVVGTKVNRTGGVMADGQRGEIIQTEDGKLAVLLDRRERHVVPYDPNSWTPAVKTPIQPMQVARIAHEADRVLRIARGEYGALEWMNLKEQDRIKFCAAGPPAKDEERRRLYLYIVKALTE